MKKKCAILSCIVICVFLLSIILSCSPVYSETGDVVVTSHSCSDTGVIQIEGYVEGRVIGDAYTLLAYNSDVPLNSITGDDLAYVDQGRLGNNGVFLIRFQLNHVWSGKSLDILIGGGARSSYKIVMDVPKLKVSLDFVENNSALYGKDVYWINQKNSYLTTENVIDSIVYGGTAIYYKFGGNWYNLLDERATGNDFLVEENAADEKEIKALGLRYYYALEINVFE